MRAILVRGLLVVAVTVAAFPVEAQIGGLIRRGREAAEKKVTAEPKTAEPAASTRNPFADPAIVFITQDQLGRFQKGLQHEIAQRNALRKSLASLKSPAEYQACSQGAMTAPEMMKMIQDMADSSANATTEQMIKAQQKMYADMQAMVTKSCGADPATTKNESLARLRQFEDEASDVAMPPAYKAPPGDSPGTASNTRAFARAYGMLKERVPVFCGKLEEKAPMTPVTITIGSDKVTVVKFPGQGQEYVFRQDEVEALTAGCGLTMKSMNALFDTQQ